MITNFANTFRVKSTFSIFVVAIALFITGCRGALETPGASSAVSGSESATAATPLAPIVLADGIRASYADIVERVSPAVVTIRSERRNSRNQRESFLDDFFQDLPPGHPNPQQGPREQNPRGGRELGLGSGVIINSDGTILTNHHVIEGASTIRVELTDKRVFTAKIIGSDPPSDLAVLKVDNVNLPALTLGDSDRVRVGDVVLALGNPLGLAQTVTAGIISAKGRQTNGPSDGSFEDFLQTDAPINRGNSGGALVSLQGELIGINSQILSTTGGSIGIGFAIPSNMAKGVMEQLLATGKVRRGRLGVGIQTITSDMAQALELKEVRGVMITDVQPGSAGEKAGVRQGDVIFAVNDERVDDGNALRNRVAGTPPGNDVKLTILRDGREQTLTANLDEYSAEQAARNAPDQPSPNKGNTPSADNGKLGLGLQPLTPELAARLQLPPNGGGLLVTEVDPEGPAATAGIAEQDVVLQVNRQPVKSFDEVRGILDQAGDRPVLILINRRGQSLFLTVQPRG